MNNVWRKRMWAKCGYKFPTSETFSANKNKRIHRRWKRQAARAERREMESKA